MFYSDNVFFYLMKDDPELVRKTVSRHVDYWKALALPDYMGGPFADHTGGLIMFSAADDADAEKLASQDPFMMVEAVEKHWLKQWILE